MKRQITWKEIEDSCFKIVKQILDNNMQYDIIIGIARGGLIPAVMVSHLLPNNPNVVCISAASYTKEHQQQNLHIYQTISPEMLFGKKGILIEDLTDTGLTLTTISNYYKIFGEIKLDTAVLFKKDCSKFEPTYCAEIVEQKKWLVFPYEQF